MRGTAVHNIQQKPDQDQEEEDQNDMVNINCISFNSKHSEITANLQTSTNQVRIIVPYNVDTGNEGNIMSLHKYKKLFPRATKGQLVAIKITKSS